MKQKISRIDVKKDLKKEQGYLKDSYETSAYPLISIITVTYNSEKYLEETIQSVLNQTYENIEYIIIDGNSTDGTLDIIKKYDKHINIWISEPDDGMYDAINKGIELSSGKYFGVLNSDDLLKPNAISIIAETFNVCKCDGIFGNIEIIDELSTILRTRYALKVSFKNLLLSQHGTFIPHPTLYLNKQRVLDEIGLYDLSYRYASDFDFLLKCIKRLFLEKIDSTILQFRYHDESITSSGKLTKERQAILVNHGLKKINYLERKVYYYFNWIQYKILNFKRS